MPNQRVGDPGNRGSTEAAGPGSVDGRHLLLVGAGPGLGMAVARRFAVGGYQVTLVARSLDGLGDLAGTLADTGAKINTIAADASDPDGLGARMRELYLGNSAPGVIVYNAVMGAPRKVMKGGSYLCAPNYCRLYRPAARLPQPIDTSACHLGSDALSARPDKRHSA